MTTNNLRSPTLPVEANVLLNRKNNSIYEFVVDYMFLYVL